MANSTIRNILSLWIFVALVTLGVGLALFINKVNTAPSDSKASALAGASIELKLNQRSDVSEVNQSNFNIGDKLSFQVLISSFPKSSEQLDKLVLKLQYPKSNFDTSSDLFNIDTTKYQINSQNIDTTCVAISALYECKRVDISKINKLNFENGEVVANLNLITKALTTANSPILIFPSNIDDFNPNSYSYIANSTNLNDPLVFADSTNASKQIKVEDQCFGDYNRKKGVIGDVVDADDLSRFASKYNTRIQLTGADLELDLDNRGASKNVIDDADLKIFTENYGFTSCNRNKSDGLP